MCFSSKMVLSYLLHELSSKCAGLCSKDTFETPGEKLLHSFILEMAENLDLVGKADVKEHAILSPFSIMKKLNSNFQLKHTARPILYLEVVGADGESVSILK